MKRVLLCAFLLCLTLSGASCTGSSGGSGTLAPSSPATTNVAAYLASVKPPDNFDIALDADTIVPHGSAAVYQATTLTYDQDTVAKLLMKSKATEEKIWAEGPQLVGKDASAAEHLNFFDDGTAFATDGEELGPVGHFTYGYTPENGILSKLQMVASLSTELPSAEALLYGYNLDSDYSLSAELAFEPRADIEKAFGKLLAAIGLSMAEPQCIRALDRETMEKHYQLYQKANPDEGTTASFSADDECYALTYRQVLDGIPVTNVGWMDIGGQLSAVGNSMPATIIQAIYARSGLVSLDVQQAYQVTIKGEPSQLLSLPKALQTLLDEYSKSILLDKVTLRSAELVYVGIPDAQKDGVFELRPAWVFGLTKQWTDEDGRTFDAYRRYDVVDAVTGRLNKGRW